MKYGSKDDLRDRLDELEQKLSEVERNLVTRDSDPGGVHMSRLVEVKDQHNELKSTVESSDESLWHQMKRTWHQDIESLLNRFEKTIKHIDDEYEQRQD